MISEKKSMQFLNVTASKQVAFGPGRLKGFVVDSTNVGTVKAWDSAVGAAGTVIFGTMTPAAGASINCFDLGFTNGLFLTIGGTALDLLVSWHPE